MRPTMKAASGRTLYRAAHSTAGAPLNFNNTERVFRDRSTLSLVRSLLVFKLCTVKPLVKNGKRLLNLSNRVLGKGLTTQVVKHSFFAHFCAGEDAKDIRPSLERLQRAGIGSILDFAAEADVAESADASAVGTASSPAQQPVAGAGRAPLAAAESAAGAAKGSAATAEIRSSAAFAAAASSAASGALSGGMSSALQAPAHGSGRTFFSTTSIRAGGSGGSDAVSAGAGAHASASAAAAADAAATSAADAAPPGVDAASERECEEHLPILMRSVRDAAGAGGFAAIKLTAIAQPELLQHISGILQDHRRAWRRFNAGAPPVGNPYLDVEVSRDQFVRALRGPSLSAEDADDLFTAIDYTGRGAIDFLAWSDFCALMRLGGVEAHAAAAYAVRGASPSAVMALLAPAAASPASTAVGVGSGAVFTAVGAAGGPARGDGEVLAPAQQHQWRQVLRRAHSLGAAAAESGVSVMVDAEQSYMQPAIDHVVIAMQRRFNRPQASSLAAASPSSSQAGSGFVAGPAHESPSLWVPPETAHILHQAQATLAAAHQRDAAAASAPGAAAFTAPHWASVGGRPPLAALPVATGQPGIHPSLVAAATPGHWPYAYPSLIARYNSRTGRPVHSTAAAAAWGAATAAAAGASGEAGAASAALPVSLAGQPGGAYPAVYNTYQCYLTDAPSRLQLALRRADREGWLFGAKLVRGAYMVQERALAAEKGYKDPIHATLADTHACYHACADTVLAACVGGGAEVMIASHNEASVRHVAGKMAELGLQPKGSGVSFGQLLGMCDHVSYTLGALGYSVHKYVPYGPVQEVIPYLLRRAQENSDMLGSAGREMGFLRTEIGRRLRLA